MILILVVLLFAYLLLDFLLSILPVWLVFILGLLVIMWGFIKSGVLKELVYRKRYQSKLR